MLMKLKSWLAGKMDTPEHVREFLGKVALIGGLVGLVMVGIALWKGTP